MSATSATAASNPSLSREVAIRLALLALVADVVQVALSAVQAQAPAAIAATDGVRPADDGGGYDDSKHGQAQRQQSERGKQTDAATGREMRLHRRMQQQQSPTNRDHIPDQHGDEGGSKADVDVGDGRQQEQQHTAGDRRLADTT